MTQKELKKERRLRKNLTARVKPRFKPRFKNSATYFPSLKRLLSFVFRFFSCPSRAQLLVTRGNHRNKDDQWPWLINSGGVSRHSRNEALTPGETEFHWQPDPWFESRYLEASHRFMQTVQYLSARQRSRKWKKGEMAVMTSDRASQVWLLTRQIGKAVAQNRHNRPADTTIKAIRPR